MNDYYYDYDGNAVGLEEWSKLIEEKHSNPEGRWRIGKDRIGESEVSTVWLGLNHNYGAGPPLIFETLVFGGELADEMDRYSTEREAQLGHKLMVQRVEKAENVVRVVRKDSPERAEQIRKEHDEQ